ncbi:Ig-like domain-containing protein, partial [Streptococcus mitis]|uniref:Ig-like domain-containing protein n=1 Tax=Streptococcus mitis TaxID=28037 RepID=UPI0039C3278A
MGIKEPTENKSEVVNSSLENKETALVENSSNTVDKSQLRTVVEELNSLLSTKLNLDDSVLSSVKERVQRAQALLDKADAVQKDINELKELLSTDLVTLSNAVKESSEVRESNTGTEAEKPAIQPSSEVRASEESQTVSAKKDALKVSVDQLKVAISEVPEHDTTKGVLEKANELLGVAQGALENTTVSLNDVEEMTKRVKRMFISVKNATTRLTSGSHDPRNGKSMDQGTGFRANGVLVEGALDNVKEYISLPAGQGSTVEGQRTRTIEKTFMTATYSKEGDKKFITYDVYFQNDGKALDGIYKNSFWFYPPRDLLYTGDSYPVGVVSDAYYERYKKKEGATGTLSENPNNFTKEGERYNVPLGALNVRNNFQDYSSQNLWRDAGGIYQLSGGPTRDAQRQQMLKQLQHNEDLNRIIKLNNNPNGPYPKPSYSHLLTVGSGQNYAYKYHVKMRLKDNVTDAQARTAGTIAVTAKEGYATTALAAYVYAATGTRLVSKPATPSIPTNLTGKAGTRTQIEVDAEAGVSVVVYDHGGKELGRSEANTSGKAFIKPTKDIPSGKVTAKAIDKAGNVSDPSNPQVATAPVPNPITVSSFTHGDTSVTLRPNGKTDIVYASIQGKAIKFEKQANNQYKQITNDAKITFTPKGDGSITITLPAGKQFKAGDRVVTRAENSDITSNTGTRASGEVESYGQLKRSDKVPVKDLSNLSPTDKERVKAAVLKANPGIEVADLTIAKNGDVTYNHRGEGSHVKREIQLKDNVNQDNVAPGKPTIETPLVGKAGTRTPITVQTEAGAKVELFDAKNHKIGEKVADNKGRVTIEPTANLVAGNVTAKATDEAGNISQPSDAKVATYPLVKQPIINIKQGERLTPEEIKQTVLLQNGAGTTNLPSNVQVTGNFDTSSAGDKKTTVTVTFPDAPAQQVEVTYKVLPTFPIARTVYDFKGMDHGNDESGYYVNPGNLPSGMVWVAKRNGEQEQSASKLREMLKADPVGTKTYTFSGKYNHGRFTNTPNDAQKLAHTGTFEHKVFDVEANRTRVTVSKGATLTEQNAKDAVAKVAGSEDLPTGTTYEWVNAQGNKQTLIANTPGVQNYRVKVTLPMSQTGQNQPDATQKRPSKIIDVKVNVKPDVPTYNTTIKANGNIKVPTVASTDRELTGTGAPGAKIKVTVPGVTINEVTVGDNGKWRVSLPKGLNSNQLNQKQLVPQDQVTITQSVGGVESDPVNVAVSLGETTIQPSVASKDGASLVAGTKNIVVKAPHDAGMVYVSYTDKATGKAHEIGLKRENINSPWVSNKPTLGEVKNTTKDAFTNTITIEMKESIAEGTAKAIANISERNYSSAVDWKTIQVTNQAPTITSAVAGNEKVLEFGENIDLKTLVTKADYEDDKDATRGTKVRTEIVSVNGQNNVKDINSRKPGTYIVKYKAIDSQGKESGEIQLTVKVREDKPTPPTATAPSDGTVTVTPTGDVDKVIVNYTDEKNAQKTVTVVKAKNGTWSSSDKPAGVTVDPRTGALLIPEDGVRDRSQVTATATKGDSRPSDPKIVTAQQRDFVPVVPDKTPVTKVTNLTPEEREKVKAKVQNRNPGKNISISTDGTATLTDPKTNISHQISGDKLVESNDKIKPTVEIPYDNVNKQEVYVYSGETNNITIKVKDNSGKISKSYLVFAANDRRGLGAEDNSYLGGGSSNGLYLTATKIHSDTPTSENQPATITVSGNLNNQPFTGEKSITRYVFAEDPSGNTNYDHVGRTDDTGALGRVKFVWKSQTSKYDAQAPGTPLLLDNADATQIENAVKQANPTFSDKIKSVTVNGNNVIVTYKDNSTDRLDASKVFKVRDSKPTPPTATAPSDGTVTVTPTGDADKVTVNYTDEKEQNKTVTVVKDKNGTWSSSDKPAGVTVDSSTGQLLIPAEGVKDKSQVTATATKGDSHPSEPTTVTAQAKDFTPVKPDEKVVVQDKSHLTPEEKKQVEDKVKAKNPGKTVTVGDDGTATVTDPSTKISHPIAGKDLVNEGFTPVKPDEKVVVQDKSHLTPEEKKQVEDKVKAKNPGKTVTVGDDGTATVTDPSTKISHPIAGKDLVNEDFTPVKPDEKVVVQDKSHLTPEEKKQVEDKVKAKNPGKTVT